MGKWMELLLFGALRSRYTRRAASAPASRVSRAGGREQRHVDSAHALP
jgi:hypothetical protein